MEKMTLRELREENKKTAAEVAAALGVSLRAVYNYEKGIRRISFEQVMILKELYGVITEKIISAQLNSCLFGR